MSHRDNPTFLVEVSNRKVKGWYPSVFGKRTSDYSVDINSIELSEKVPVKENVFMNTQYEHIPSSIGVSERVGYQP